MKGKGDEMVKKFIPILLVGLFTMVSGINFIAKADGTTKFTMMISSDPQFGRDDAKKTEEYNTISKQYEDMNALAADGELKLNVLGCIIDGDLTNYGHKEQLDIYRELTGKLTMRVYPGLGNHDYDINVDDTAQNKGADNMVVYMYDWIQDNKTNLNSYDIKGKTYSSQSNVSFYCEGSLAYSFDIGKVHMIQLQNYPSYTRQWAGSSFGFLMMVTIKNSFAWLENDLTKARWGGKIIIINLHDYGDSDYAIFTGDGRTRFEALVKEYGVSAVFCGHVHGSFGYQGNVSNSCIPYFRCGGTCENEYLVATFDTENKEMIVQKRNLNSSTGTYEFSSSEGPYGLNDATPTYGFDDDCKAGDRTYDVGFGGAAQWMADLNGDGRSDYIYNRSDSKEYRVLLSDPTQSAGENAFLTEKLAGTRKYDVGYDGKAQWLADVNGDGRVDLVYNRDDTHEYWVMFGKTDGAFDTAQKWGLRDSGNGVGYDGKAQWLADVNGDGCADLVYNRDDTREYWVILGKREIPKGMILSDKLAGTRQNDVGYDGKAQWLADVNGDGRADYVYNHNDTAEYWVMLSQEDNTFATDTKWLTRDNGVGYDIYGQGWADLNGDGKMDFIYNHKGTKDYQVMLSRETVSDQYWGVRDYNVAWNGKGAFLSDINGDGLPDLVYIRDDSKEIRVMLSKVTGTETN
jgi:hypothetical protein